MTKDQELVEKIVERLWAKHHMGVLVTKIGLYRDANDFISICRQHEWIPVSERLPDEDVDCRVFFADCEQEPFYRLHKGVWQVQKDNGVWSASAFDIEYYYVCPEPPKEESDE